MIAAHNATIRPEAALGRRPVLETRVHILDRQPSLTCMCPGFELDVWREDASLDMSSIAT